MYAIGASTSTRWAAGVSEARRASVGAGVTMSNDVEPLVAELRRIACAYAQVSQNFHESYYGKEYTQQCGCHSGAGSVYCAHHDHNLCCQEQSHGHINKAGVPKS